MRKPPHDVTISLVNNGFNTARSGRYVHPCSFALGTASKHRVETFPPYLVPPAKRVVLPDPAEDGISHHLIGPTPKLIDVFSELMKEA